MASVNSHTAATKGYTNERNIVFTATIINTATSLLSEIWAVFRDAVM
jgi:hypothetical protein